jgi:hypothetical protein
VIIQEIENGVGGMTIQTRPGVDSVPAQTPRICVGGTEQQTNKKEKIYMTVPHIQFQVMAARSGRTAKNVLS